MKEVKPEDVGETPAVEVRVYEHGELIQTRLCESAEEAAALVAWWEETPGVECEVADFSATTHDTSDLEIGDVDPDAGFPNVIEVREDR